MSRLHPTLTPRARTFPISTASLCCGQFRMVFDSQQPLRVRRSIQDPSIHAHSGYPSLPFTRAPPPTAQSPRPLLPPFAHALDLPSALPRAAVVTVAMLGCSSRATLYLANSTYESEG